MTERARFERHFAPAGTGACWLWTGRVDRQGYGQFRLDSGRVRRAHRAAWLLYVGPLAPEQCVCHDCPGGDNPRCVNPAHLFVGSRGDNNRDAIRKGRLRRPPVNVLRGERNPQARFTNVEAAAIRARRTGQSAAELAAEYGVGIRTMRRLLRGETYAAAAAPWTAEEAAEWRALPEGGW